VDWKVWKRFRKANTSISDKDFALVKRINQKFDSLKTVSDSVIKENFDELKPKAQSIVLDEKNTLSDDLIIQGFANIKQASWRTLKMAHHDVQLLAGISMVRGNIAEMATGEGKTLVATLPASLFALWGQGVHVMTVNAYLAQRDFETMSPVYELLGLSANFIATRMPDTEKAKAYRSDITYGVGNDFGFDYLRDQLRLQSRPQRRIGSTFQTRLRGASIAKHAATQRGHAFAVIDEADSVMIDEASSALILSGSSGQAHPRPEPYILASKVSSQLTEGEHYLVDIKTRRIQFSPKGVQLMIGYLDRETKNSLVRPWESYVANALSAKHFFFLDIEYLVIDDSIQIVDAFTGRRFEDRTWSEGLHQAVESKEQVTITEESQSMLSISRHHFFRLYQHRCGMTGTAVGCEDELDQIFGMGVKRIPLHKDSQRKYDPLVFFDTTEDKWDGVVEQVKKINELGAPVLVGTQSVHESEELSKRLVAEGIFNNVLNARNDEAEAELVAEAGKRKAVTVATNMAGRGTDIPLNPQVRLLGGLYVIITEPNRSRRIDRQLIGRCARQGDPGIARIFCCKEDAIFEETNSLKWTTLRKDGGWDFDAIAEYVLALQQRNDIADFQKRLNMMSHSQWKEGLISKISGKVVID